MVRSGLAGLLALALGACDASDPLGLYPEPTKEVVAPLALTGRVVDEADLLTSEQEQQLTEKLARLEEEGLAQMVAVTTPSLGGRPIADYSLALGRAWRIGDADRDDGLMIVVAPKERAVRIEVGEGLENVIDDLFAKEVIEEVTPDFGQERYFEGIDLGIDRLESRLREPRLEEAA